MNGEFKDHLYEQLARVGQALGNGHRLEMLDVLCQGERGVEELAREVRLTVANASQHLQVLHQAHLVRRRRQGVQVRYRLADSRVMRLWILLRDVAAAELPEVAMVVDQEFDEGELLKPVGQAEARRRLAAGDVLLLDVRPRSEYVAGHIGGAISIPLDELEERMPELPPGREILAYCRGPYCAFANQAVRRLRAAGLWASRLELGYPEWVLDGGSVEVGAA
ncbi:MAG: metalloregulator ArsR/SmtB family transcription factor [Candidatus Dormibacteraeota bacterium]|nr:metalloregulator ArsR/SmtB family transcription factor [Candidatus Dormibacteraeota bacterium]